MINYSTKFLGGSIASQWQVAISTIGCMSGPTPSILRNLWRQSLDMCTAPDHQCWMFHNHSSRHANFVPRFQERCPDSATLKAMQQSSRQSPLKGKAWTMSLPSEQWFPSKKVHNQATEFVIRRQCFSGVCFEYLNHGFESWMQTKNILVAIFVWMMPILFFVD